MTEIGMARQITENMFLGGHHAPIPRGGLSVPKFLGPRVHTVNQILHEDQTRCEKIFTESTGNADARSVYILFYCRRNITPVDNVVTKSK